MMRIYKLEQLCIACVWSTNVLTAYRTPKAGAMKSESVIADDIMGITIFIATAFHTDWGGIIRLC
jgi:hypothetical protein